jgi:fructose-1,6-bisphosphatase/sedoheptulose 1,7-bisphosphatase-like protein
MRKNYQTSFRDKVFPIYRAPEAEMRQIAVQPTQWTAIRDMNDIDRQLSDQDASCFAELRNVLKRHGLLDRFGIMLLHKHFELTEGECLLETMDVEARTLTVRPVPNGDVAGAVQTQWRLSSADPLQWCSGFCNYNKGHKHGHQQGISA